MSLGLFSSVYFEQAVVAVIFTVTHLLYLFSVIIFEPVKQTFPFDCKLQRAVI